MTVLFPVVLEASFEYMSPDEVNDALAPGLIPVTLTLSIYHPANVYPFFEGLENVTPYRTLYDDGLEPEFEPPSRSYVILYDTGSYEY